MHGGTLTRCKYCRAIISLVQVVKPGTVPHEFMWVPIEIPPVLGVLDGNGDERLVVPRLRKIVTCTILTPQEAKERAVSDLILGSELHRHYCTSEG